VRSGPRLVLLLLLPLAAAALAVVLLLRAHGAVLDVARGPRPEPRTEAERAALLSHGLCAVSRRDQSVVGKLDPVEAPRGGVYTLQRLDVRSTFRADTADIVIMHCPGTPMVAPP
jgi:hypothetical protein